MVGFKEIFTGKQCRECEAQGVFCVQPGVFSHGGDPVPSEPKAPIGGSAIYVDGKQVVHTNQSIDACPILTGENTQAEIVAQLKETARRTKNQDYSSRGIALDAPLDSDL